MPEAWSSKARKANPQVWRAIEAQGRDQQDNSEYVAEKKTWHPFSYQIKSCSFRSSARERSKRPGGFEARCIWAGSESKDPQGVGEQVPRRSRRFSKSTVNGLSRLGSLADQAEAGRTVAPSTEAENKQKIDENGVFRSRFGCETMLLGASNPKFCRRLARGLACELGAESWIEVRKAPLRSSSPRLRFGSLSGSTTCHEAAKGLGATAHSASLQLPAQRRFLIQSQCCLWPGPEVALPSTAAAPLQGIGS